MPKGSRSGPKRFKKMPPGQKLLTSRVLTIFGPKFDKNTFEMMFNKRTHGFLDIFSSFLTISNWNIDFFKWPKMAIFGKFLILKANISKAIKDIRKSICNFLDNSVGSILWKFEVNRIKIVGGDPFFVIEHRCYGNAQ